MDGWEGRLLDGWAGEWMDVWMDGWVEVSGRVGLRCRHRRLCHRLCHRHHRPVVIPVSSTTLEFLAMQGDTGSTPSVVAEQSTAVAGQIPAFAGDRAITITRVVIEPGSHRERDGPLSRVTTYGNEPPLPQSSGSKHVMEPCIFLGHPRFMGKGGPAQSSAVADSDEEWSFTLGGVRRELELQVPAQRSVACENHGVQRDCVGHSSQRPAQSSAVAASEENWSFRLGDVMTQRDRQAARGAGKIHSGKSGMDESFWDYEWNHPGNQQYLTAGNWETGNEYKDWDDNTGNLSIAVFNFCTVAQRLSMDQKIRLVVRSKSQVQIQQEVNAAFIAAILRHTNLPGDTNRSKPVNESSGAPNSAVAGNGALTDELLMVTYNEDPLEGKIAGLSFLGRSSHVYAIRLVRYIVFNDNDGTKK